jgi:hypothetical protein
MKHNLINMHNIKNLVVVLALALPTITQAQLIISPVAVNASSAFADPSTAAVNTINGSGLSFALNTGDTIPGTYPTHSAVNNNIWHTAVGVLTPTITFDLGASYDVTGFHLWNFQQFDTTGVSRGIQTTNILGSSDGISFTTLISNQTFTQATGLSTYTGEDYSLSAANIRYVRFGVLSNYGDVNVTGLSEVRFLGTVAVPEPSSLAMLALGGLVMLWAVRRKMSNAL